MQTFELYIDDDWYTVTTLRFLLLRDARRAREKAESAMSESAHHRGVEVYRGGALLICERAAPQRAVLCARVNACVCRV